MLVSNKININYRGHYSNSEDTPEDWGFKRALWQICGHIRRLGIQEGTMANLWTHQKGGDSRGHYDKSVDTPEEWGFKRALWQICGHTRRVGIQEGTMANLWTH